jgi:hypothetical protein
MRKPLVVLSGTGIRTFLGRVPSATEALHLVRERALPRKATQNDFGTARLDSPVEVANPQLSVIQRFNILCDRSQIRI